MLPLPAKYQKSSSGGNDMIASYGMVIVVVIVSSSVLFCVVVDYFRFGAVWILSTRRLSVVRVLFH